MRSDMKKVLTERPRYGHANCYKQIRRRVNGGDPEALPTVEGMRRPHRDRKQFSDLLGPLYRFLESCVGRRWDDVWSEICSQLSNNTVDSHLKGHVPDRVDQLTYIEDGKVKCRSRYWREPKYLYVHPETGILCAAERSRPVRPRLIVRDGIRYEQRDGVLYPIRKRSPVSGRRPVQDAYPRKIIGPEKEAVRIDGLWYWAVFADVPPPFCRLTVHGYVWDKQTGYDVVLRKYVSEGRYRAGRRQMNCRDLRKYGLRNAAV